MIKKIDMETAQQPQMQQLENLLPIWAKLLFGVIGGGSTLWGGSSLGEVSQKISVIETELLRVSFASEQQVLWKDRMERDITDIQHRIREIDRFKLEEKKR